MSKHAIQKSLTFRREPILSIEWLKPLAIWLEINFQGNLSILDFGCGHFNLAVLLKDSLFKFDGYDPDEIERKIAISQSTNKKHRIFKTAEEIPNNHYDIILINSVIQYLNNESELKEILTDLKEKISKSGRIILSDIIPENYTPIRSAISDLYFASRSNLFFPYLKHITNSILFQKKQGLLKTSFVSLEKLSKEIDFDCRLIEVQLTPSHNRFAVMLTNCYSSQ